MVIAPGSRLLLSRRHGRYRRRRRVISVAWSSSSRRRRLPGSSTRLETEARGQAATPTTFALLGLGYQQLFRESGDPTWLKRAGGALRTARGGAPSDPLAATGLAQLAVTQHRFRDASSSPVPHSGSIRRAAPPVERSAMRSSISGPTAPPSPSTTGLPRQGRVSPHTRESRSPVSSRVAGSQRSTQWSSRSKPDRESGAGGLGAGAVRQHAPRRRSHRGRRGRLPHGPRPLAWLRPRCRRACTCWMPLGERFGRSADRLRTVVERLPSPQYAILLTDVLLKAGATRTRSRRTAWSMPWSDFSPSTACAPSSSTAVHDLDRGVRVGDALGTGSRGLRRSPECRRCGRRRMGAVSLRAVRQRSRLVLEGWAPRHEGRSLFLPPGDDRTLPRK